MMRLSTQLVVGFFYLFVLLLFCQSRPVRRPMRWRCPPSCNCSSDNVLCDGAASIPNSYPSNIISVSFRRCIFTSVSPGSFIPSQTLQILLFTSSTFDTIADDAFLGLKHLEYLFIENNKIRSISGNAFRGLKSLVHLSLSNNQLRSLPRGLFGNLPAVKHIDLRGNALNCDCQIKWLVQWMTGAGWNVAVWPPLPCAEPSKLSGRNLSDLTVKDFYCVASNVIQRWTFKFPSLSVHSFLYLSEQNVVITHPFEGRCSFMEWDHVAYRFREYDSIKGVSIVSCLPLVIGDQLFVVVAQLFGGSSIYRWDPNPGTISSFRLFQKLPETRKPNDVEYFRSGDEHFFIIADSAKSGASTLYRWDGRGFYTHQKMPHWYRDTDAEPMLLSGSTHLIMSSGSQRPVVYRFEDKRLRRLTDIPEAWDVYAVKHFTDPEDGVFACLVSYISESSLVRWDGSMFRQLQQLPSRGSHVFQPLLLGDKWHAFLGHDFGYAFVYQLEKWKHWEIEETGDREGQRGPLVQFQELRILAARSFTTVQVRGRQFVFVASFGGDTVVYEYVEYENNV